MQSKEGGYTPEKPHNINVVKFSYANKIQSVNTFPSLLTHFQPCNVLPTGICTFKSAFEEKAILTQLTLHSCVVVHLKRSLPLISLQVDSATTGVNTFGIKLDLYNFGHSKIFGLQILLCKYILVQSSMDINVRVLDKNV